MTVLSIGCIYDLETKEPIQIMVVTDGKENLKEGQGWLDVPANLYKENNSSIKSIKASREDIDKYITEVLK